MKNLKTIGKSLLLILLFIAVLLLALPKINFNIGATNINFSLADDILAPQGIRTSDFRKGEGLYSTNIIKANFSDKALESDINKTFAIIKERLNLSLLGDVKATLVNNPQQKYIQFEFPQYYSQPLEYAKWITATGSISFVTAEETPQIMDINDYDIQGELRIEYTSNFKDHLSFYFNNSKGFLVNSYFASGNQYFLMYIDNTPVYYVIDYDTYIDTNLYRVRAIPVISGSTQDAKTIADFTNITRSYFNSSELPESLIVDENIIELPPTTKPATLSVMAISILILSIAGLFLLSFIKKIRLSTAIQKVAWLLIFIAFDIALLKFVGAILNTDMLIAYFLSIAIVWLMILNWDSFTRPVRISIGLILVFGFITKFYALNFAVGTIAGIVSVSLVALIISSFYRELIKVIITFLQRTLTLIKTFKYNRNKTK